MQPGAALDTHTAAAVAPKRLFLLVTSVRLRPGEYPPNISPSGCYLQDVYTLFVCKTRRAHFHKDIFFFFLPSLESVMSLLGRCQQRVARRHATLEQHKRADVRLCMLKRTRTDSNLFKQKNFMEPHSNHLTVRCI